MSIWQGVRFFYNFIRGVIDPSNVMHAVRAGDVLNEAGVFEASVDKIKSLPGGREFLINQPYTYDYAIENFKKYSEGTLGAHYYQYLKKQGLDPGVFPKITIKSDSDYLETLIRQLHDLLHVITGFDTSIAGELGLQAFKAKQICWPFALIAFAGGGLITLFRNPRDLSEIIDNIGKGYKMGCEMKPFILVNWNEMWDKSYDEVIDYLYDREGVQSNLMNPLDSQRLMDDVKPLNLNN